MTYFAAFALALPITMCAIIGLLESREIFKWFVDRRNERSVAAVGDIGAMPALDFDHELRFTQSLLALSRVRSPKLDDFQVHEPDVSSSLVSVHRPQSKTRDRAV